MKNNVSDVPTTYIINKLAIGELKDIPTQAHGI